MLRARRRCRHAIRAVPGPRKSLCQSSAGPGLGTSQYAGRKIGDYGADASRKLSRARRIFAPALAAQCTGRAFAAAVTPIMPRAALAEITGVGMFADQVDQPCPAEFIRQ